MQRLLVVCVVFLAAIALPAAQRDQTDRVDRALQGLRAPIAIKGRPAERWSIAERMATHHLPGASLAIVDDGRIVWTGGFGVAEAGTTTAVTPSTLFQAQSISKPVTATAALMLAAAGKLSLDVPVNRYLTSWKLPENALQSPEPVTIRRILSHTAGVTVGGFAGYKRGEALPTLLQILDGVRPASNPPIRVDTIPGTVARYSGGGMMVLQQLLMDVSGESFPELMRRLVLEPAGMTSSRYVQPLPPSQWNDAASGHDGTGAIVEGKWPVQPELAAGGLWSTPTDLARWALEIAKASQGNASAFFDKATATGMLTVQRPPFGLGVYVEGSANDLSFSHAGSIWGFRANVIMYPALGKGAVVMTNGDGGDGLIAELLTSIATEFAWPRGGQIERSVVALTLPQLDALTGRYVLPPAPSGTPVYLEVSRQGTDLFAELIGLGPRPKFSMYPESADAFFTADGTSFLFVRSASGQGLKIRLGSIEGNRAP
jgi:CubicO group peptidase (beta-lactamase class C family)